MELLNMLWNVATDNHLSSYSTAKYISLSSLHKAFHSYTAIHGCRKALKHLFAAVITQVH